MKVLNSWLPMLVLAISLAEPAYSHGGGGAGGGFGAGSAGVSGVAPGGGFAGGGDHVGGGANVAAAKGFSGQGNGASEFHRTPAERRDFDHRRGIFGGGFGWGYGGYDYPNYGYSYDEQRPVKDDYDERIRSQDQKRMKKPDSAFVKNYSWPSSNKSLATSNRAIHKSVY
jgi:hypothetical protein